MKHLRQYIKKIIRESMREEEISPSGLYVVIGNAGRGRTNSWPSSEEPQAYSKIEAEAIAKEQNDFWSTGWISMHFFAWPLERALEKATADTYSGFENLMRQHGVEENR